MFCRRCTHKFPFNRNGREMLLYYCLILLSLALVQTLRAKYKVIIQSACGSFGLRSTMSSKAVILVFFIIYTASQKGNAKNETWVVRRHMVANRSVDQTSFGYLCSFILCNASSAYQSESIFFPGFKFSILSCSVTEDEWMGLFQKMVTMPLSLWQPVVDAYFVWPALKSRGTGHQISWSIVDAPVASG